MSTKVPRRKSPRSGPHGEVVQRQLLSLIEALLHPDDERRHANIDAVLRVLRPITKVHVVDALIDRLAHRSGLSTRVISTLSHFGTAALARLTQRFQATRSAALQHSIVDTLSAMVPALDGDERNALLDERTDLPRYAADHAVRERVDALLDVLAREVKAQSEGAMASTPGAPILRAGNTW